MPRGKNNGNKGGMNALQTVDLSKLESTTDEDLTQILKARYEQDCIYTRIGDQALVSVNPNKTLSICSDDQSLNYVAEYKDTNGQNTNQLPPHIFQLVNQTYLHMRRTGVDQSIIIRFVKYEITQGRKFQGSRAKIRVFLRHEALHSLIKFFFYLFLLVAIQALVKQMLIS
jgi:hypothetical protein